MIRLAPRLGGVDDRWRYALLGASVSIPSTLLGYWQTGSEMSLSSVFLGGLLAGYLAARSTGTTEGVGVRTGVLAALPAAWPLFDLLAAASALGGPTWFLALGTVSVVGTAAVVALLVVAFSALLGTVGARVGGWLSGSDGRRRPPATGG